MERPRILLVDDQLEVVEGLRRVLARVARDFEFDLAGSGAQALVELDHRPYVMVISDLRMAEMNGIELLEQVARRSSLIARVLLSGTFEADAATRALSIAHRFLCKPCNARELSETCRQLHRLGPAMAATEVGAIHALAIDADAIARAREATDRHALVRAVGTQPALIAAVLHALGSEFLGSRAEPTTLEEAIAAIGHAGFDRVLGSGALLAVDGAAATDVAAHVAAARDRAAAVTAAGGTTTDVLAALLVDVDRLGSESETWRGLRPRGGDVALLTLWGVTSTVVDRVRQLSSPAAQLDRELTAPSDHPRSNRNSAMPTTANAAAKPSSAPIDGATSASEVPSRTSTA